MFGTLPRIEFFHCAQWGDWFATWQYECFVLPTGQGSLFDGWKLSVTDSCPVRGSKM